MDTLEHEVGGEAAFLNGDSIECDNAWPLFAFCILLFLLVVLVG